KSRCTCAFGPRQPNQTMCMGPPACQPDQVWNSSTSSCESHSSVLSNTLLVKIVLILLLKLIICNLVRIMCYSKRVDSQQDLHGTHLNSRFFETNRSASQSRSLLSLPPYEAIFSDHTVVAQQSDDCLPTYEEALQSRGYKALNT